MSGAAYDATMAVRERAPGPAAPRMVLFAMTGAGTVALVARKRLRTREELIPEWSADDKPAGLTNSALIAQGVILAGGGLVRAFIATRDLSIRFFGEDPAHQAIARAVNMACWGAGAMLAYHAGVAYIGRANEKIEPAYADPPASTLRSGSPDSKSSFGDLGLQGRRYVTDVITVPLIEKTLGEPALAAFCPLGL